MAYNVCFCCFEELSVGRFGHQFKPRRVDLHVHQQLKLGALQMYYLQNRTVACQVGFCDFRRHRHRSGTSQPSASSLPEQFSNSLNGSRPKRLACARLPSLKIRDDD